MLSVTYTVTGIDLVRRDIGKIQLANLQNTVADILDDMKKEAAQYPPELPNQRYRRTEELKFGWLDSEPLFDFQGDSFSGVIENPRSYGPFVQGQEEQALIHQGRWRTVEALMEVWEDRAAQRIEEAMIRQVGT